MSTGSSGSGNAYSLKCLEGRRSRKFAWGMLHGPGPMT
jgi:hypothetical protein